MRLIQRLGWAAAGTVLGFLLGGVGPRLASSTLEAERDQLRVDLALAQQKASPRPRAMLPVPGMNEVFEKTPPTPSPTEDPDTGTDKPPSPDGGEGLTVEEGGGAPDPAAMLDEFNLAVDAQRLRASQSRAALEEQADLSEADLEELDLILEDMNASLAAYGEDLMALALSGEEPSAEEMLGLTHEVTGILYGAQTQVNDLLGEEGVAEADPSARQVWNHIDLEVFRDAVIDMAEATGAADGEGGGGQ